jgi:hypothetical protein
VIFLCIKMGVWDKPFPYCTIIYVGIEGMVKDHLCIKVMLTQGENVLSFNRFIGEASSHDPVILIGLLSRATPFPIDF